MSIYHILMYKFQMGIISCAQPTVSCLITVKSDPDPGKKCLGLEYAILAVGTIKCIQVWVGMCSIRICLMLFVDDA